MICFLEKAVIFLPPSMFERNVLGSNLMSFLDAGTSGMIAPFSKGANAQNVNSV
jgi:hypothetical protein